MTEAPAATPVGSGNPSMPTKSLGPLSGTRVGDDALGSWDGTASPSGRRRKGNSDIVEGWGVGAGHDDVSAGMGGDGGDGEMGRARVRVSAARRGFAAVCV